MQIVACIAFRYYYKYIINGHWRHSTSSPTERDERGNINNVIMIGDTASVRPIIQPQKKVSPWEHLLVNYIGEKENQIMDLQSWELMKKAKVVRDINLIIIYRYILGE